MKLTKIHPKDIYIGMQVHYRRPFLGRVGEEILPAQVICTEQDTKGNVSTVQLHIHGGQGMDCRYITTVPNNLFE